MKKVYRVYIYRESPSLPKKGWFQGCFVCHTVTSNYIFFKMTESHRKVYEYNTYVVLLNRVLLMLFERSVTAS